MYCLFIISTENDRGDNTVNTTVHNYDINITTIIIIIFLLL